MAGSGLQRIEEFSALRETIATRSAHLAHVANELKTELFGIDSVIDRVIDSIRAWYVLPEIINRPVIVCLWGLTGTGKTQLTRSLSQKLGFYDKFVEVQMDGFSSDAWYNTSAISSMLADSSIEEGTPGVLVLDEFQRYRTIDDEGQDVKVERYMDVWALLSDGRLPPALSFMNDLEFSLANSSYDANHHPTKSSSASDDDTEDQASVRSKKFSLSPHEAKEFKSSLKLREPLLEIMSWTAQDIQIRMQAFRDEQTKWETDYSKLLIFVCGNLDEMYDDIANRVEDCDTDADTVHEQTKGMSIVDVKRALSDRFKPEQIARLGNNHVVYPSFNRATYEKLIDVTCARYGAEIEQSSSLCFVVSQDLKNEIYNNAVFPTQGTRPLFSAIHTILSSPLVNFTLWALENGAQAGERLEVTVDSARTHLLVRLGEMTHLCPVTFELNRLKQRKDPNFRAMLAVHEAGHAIVYATLFRRPPTELKINAATFSGGYNSYGRLEVNSARNVLDSVCACLGGRAAEEWVFGVESCTSGGQSDIEKATNRISQYVRQFGFSDWLSRINTEEAGRDVNFDVMPTNARIEELLQKQYARAKELLAENDTVFMRIVQALMDHGEVSRDDLADWLGLTHSGAKGVLEPYAAKLEAFSARIAANQTGKLKLV